MKRTSIILLFFILTTASFAQMIAQPSNVFIFVADSMYAMHPITSQTEIKKGWDIQGFNVGRKTKRYFYGKQAKQKVNKTPKFAIFPTTQHLNDYVLVRLNERKNARNLPCANIHDCDYIRIELNTFRIENLPNFGFAVTPLIPLFPGEYILVDITQKSCNEYGDFKAYDITVTE